MSARVLLSMVMLLVVTAFGVCGEAQEPFVDESVVFAEEDGAVAVEAEHFFKQTATDVRAFHLTHTNLTPAIGPDGDPNHSAGASGGAYIEILPDTRRTHDDKLISGENFLPSAGKMAIVHYKIHFATPGRYYVWVRAHSTGPEDNGLHVGIDGEWPESGSRMQWCDGKHQWTWQSRQRTNEEHCGEPYKIYLDVREAGEHVVAFSMREDGFDFDKFILTTDREFVRPEDVGPSPAVARGSLPISFPLVAPATVIDEPAQTQSKSSSETVARTASSPTKPVSEEPLQLPRGSDGDGTIRFDGELKTWHKVTLNLHGPYAHEKDNSPNPFTDYRMTVSFVHSDGTEYAIPGYFAADGDAANTSAESGTLWRAHFSPDRVGQWSYLVSFERGDKVALDADAQGTAVASCDGRRGSIEIGPSDKQGRDLRAHGRLHYVGKRYLQFAGTGQYFLKVGADAPETLLAYADFDNTIAGNPRKVPLKSWTPHIGDWKTGDPTWGNGKGKGLIGAINYLSDKGCNAFSFLTYNASGDGDNVWPFIHRDDKMHYDCSKLDQWSIVFDHGTARGMYLHFKMQETENDDHTRGEGVTRVDASLDGGDLGEQRKLYCRELIARFGHNLALNWNLGEENTQTTEQQQAMINYIADLDPYDHLIVIHTFPGQQDKVYRPLIGSKSKLTGVSLQNDGLETTHAQTVKWVEASANAGIPWVVAFDESGSAAHAQCPDLGYRGFDGHDNDGQMVYTQHKVRKQTLWGTLMGGGAGCEYYFGYKFAENDLVCEDWRSRDQSWDYCRIAIGFFHGNQIPFWEMVNADDLVGNPDHGVDTYCFAKPGDTYVVYMQEGEETEIDLSGTSGPFAVKWFNPREVGTLQDGSIKQVQGGGTADLGQPPADSDEDWVVLLRK